MKILRSILAVVVGSIVGFLFIMAIEAVNGFIYPPPEGKSGMEWMKEINDGSPAAKEWIRSMPTSAMALVQVAWAVGAAVGGAVSAWIAGRARVLDAGIIGALVLVVTVINFLEMKAKLDYTHPDWLIVTGLLLPLPLALLGGKLVAVLCTAARVETPP